MVWIHDDCPVKLEEKVVQDRLKLQKAKCEKEQKQNKVETYDLRTLVQKANSIRQEVRHVDELIDAIKQCNENIAEIAVIFDPSTCIKSNVEERTTTEYMVKIDAIFISKKLVDGKVVDCDLESIMTRGYLSKLRRKKISYEYMYIYPVVYDKCDMKSPKTVVFWSTDKTTNEHLCYGKDNEVLCGGYSYLCKVVNL